MKEFLAKKTVGFYVFLASALLAFFSVLFYSVRGGDVLTEINSAVIVLFIIGIILNLLLAIKDIKPLEIIPFVLYFIALAIFLDSEINFMGNVFWGTDGNYFDALFILATLTGLLSVISGMTAAIMKVEKED